MDNNIRFTEYDVEKNSRGKRDFERLRGVSVPVILIGDSRMDGFSEQRFEQNWAYVNSQ
jgi:glutaredoxin